MIFVLPHKQIELKLQAAVLPSCQTPMSPRSWSGRVPDPKFGDYQCNALMALAKARKMNPRQLATDVLAKLDVGTAAKKLKSPARAS